MSNDKLKIVAGLIEYDYLSDNYPAALARVSCTQEFRLVPSWRAFRWKVAPTGNTKMFNSSLGSRLSSRDVLSRSDVMPDVSIQVML